MSEIKAILDEITAESGSNMKMEILGKYTENELLRSVLYLAKSKRVKFYIKQIPEFTTNGKNMSLEWALGKLGDISGRDVRGNDAIEYLTDILSSVSADDAYVIERIIDKDLKIGMGTSNINKVFKDLIEKTPYMGAKSYSEDLVRKLFDNGPAYSQVKMDGRYCNAIIMGNEVELESRQGETTFVGDAAFLKELERFEDCVLNGELTIDGYERYEANGMVASIVDIEGKREERGEVETAKKIENFEKKHCSYEEALSKIRFTVWDVITTDEYFAKKSKVEYLHRLNRLKDMIVEYDCRMVKVVETLIVTSFEDAMKHFQKVLARGDEGTIVKDYNGTWKDGKPNWQVKMKLDMHIDLRIVECIYGEKGTKNENVISRLLVESDCGQLRTQPSGMKESEMKYITENQEKLIGTIVEVKCCGLSQDSEGNWSTLHPSVVKLRDDKDTCDSLESAKEVEAMALGLKNA